MDNFLRPGHWIIYLLLIVLFSSCFKTKPQVERSYYFWRISNMTPQEREFLKQQSIQKLYARLLDVDWSETQGAVPVSGINLDNLQYQLNVVDSMSVNIVPVVFITNKTFTRIDSASIPLLAKRLVRRCLPAFDSVDIAYENEYNYYWKYRYYKPLSPHEIQFDCDWTVSTAAKYFYFLKEVKKLLPSDSIIVSATVRLHQFKYSSKTGVPPVNRGMLMVYNITDPKEYGLVNSIYDHEKANAYFTNNRTYPLPLDIVLPAWSWCLIFRNQKFYQIENELSEADMKQLSFLQSKGQGWYSVTRDTVYGNLFLRPGDEIKAEGIDEKTLQDAAALAKKAVNSKRFSVALFELSEKEIKKYSHETIESLYGSFH